MWGRSTGAACRSRLRSDVIISTIWRLLRIRARNCSSCSSGRGRTCGLTASAKRASTTASSSSVLAFLPMERPKSRTCRGLTTATACPATVKSAAAWYSYPPLDSMLTSLGRVAPRLVSSDAIPSGSLVVLQTPGLRRYAHVQVGLGHVDPYVHFLIAHRSPPVYTEAGLPLCPILADTDLMSGQLFGLWGDRGVTIQLSSGLQ